MKTYNFFQVRTEFTDNEFMAQMLFPLGKVPGFGVPADMPVPASSWSLLSSVPLFSFLLLPLPLGQDETASQGDIMLGFLQLGQTLPS